MFAQHLGGSVARHHGFSKTPEDEVRPPRAGLGKNVNIDVGGSLRDRASLTQ
jgi:hypothetical protein